MYKSVSAALILRVPVLLKGTVTLTVEKANTLVITLQTFSWFLLSNSTLAGWSSASWPFRVAHSVFFSSNFLFSSSTFSATSSCRPSLDEVLLSSTFCFFAAQIDDHSASLLPCSAIKTSKGSLDTLGLGNCWSFACRSNKQRVTFDMIEAFENMHNKLDLNCLNDFHWIRLICCFDGLVSVVSPVLVVSHFSTCNYSV